MEEETQLTYPIKCTDCGIQLPEDSGTESRQPCPQCGSLRRTVELRIEERIQIHEMVGLKARKPGAKKPTVEMAQGDDVHRDSGR